MKLTDQALQDLKKQCIDAAGRNSVVANHQSLMLQMIEEITESRKGPAKAAAKEEAPPPHPPPAKPAHTEPPPKDEKDEEPKKKKTKE